MNIKSVIIAWFAKSFFLYVCSRFIKMWEIGDYICGESRDTYGRQKTPVKCRGLDTLCMKTTDLSM